MGGSWCRRGTCLFASIPNDGHLGNLRRALIATLLFSWVRISAALGMRVRETTPAERLSIHLLGPVDGKRIV
jgi:hypothetical protein